jgi:hypothetical protein
MVVKIAQVCLKEFKEGAGRENAKDSGRLGSQAAESSKVLGKESRGRGLVMTVRPYGALPDLKGVRHNGPAGLSRYAEWAHMKSRTYGSVAVLARTIAALNNRISAVYL